MTIQVRYFGPLKQAAGVAAEAVDAGTILDLLPRLADRHGEPLRRHLLDPAGRPLPGLLCAVNDEVARAPDDAPLRDGDTVTLLAPIAGG